MRHTPVRFTPCKIIILGDKIIPELFFYFNLSVPPLWGSLVP